ncbi:DNA-binding protein [Caldivirga sp. UBA161]|uniref:DNA-binding protein n=1 Tax=Caldivirga sp. UBA161 TaxID=1915569 RepID=UPI0025C45C11|nr:DNA-binding protein [Caldivirga sp. UBA161]
MANAQLSAENAAKAIIAIYRIPSWSRDPLGELEALISNIPGDLIESVRELAVIVRRLAPEHGRSTYGEPERRLTPWEIYSKHDAENALNMAGRAVEIMKMILKALGLGIPSS